MQHRPQQWLLSGHKLGLWVKVIVVLVVLVLVLRMAPGTTQVIGNGRVHKGGSMQVCGCQQATLLSRLCPPSMWRLVWAPWHPPCSYSAGE